MCRTQPSVSVVSTHNFVGLGYSFALDVFLFLDRELRESCVLFLCSSGVLALFFLFWLALLSSCCPPLFDGSLWVCGNWIALLQFVFTHPPPLLVRTGVLQPSAHTAHLFARGHSPIVRVTISWYESSQLHRTLYH